MEFTNNWTTGAVELVDLDGSKALLFDTNDFIINEAYIDQPARIEADFLFKGLDFGIIMKYNEIEYEDSTIARNGFLLYSVNGTYAKLSKILYGEDGWYGYTIKGVPSTCQIDSTVTLAVDMTDKYTYRFYINGTQVFSIRIEDSSFRAGHAGLFSHTGNYCKEFRISTQVPSGWQFDEPTDRYIGALGDEI